MELSRETQARARQRGWPDELIARIEASTASDAQVKNLSRSTITPDRIAGWLDFLERDPDNPFAKAPLDILNTPAETGVRATPSAEGMLLSDINIKSYGVVPDHWSSENDTPRGTEALPGPILPASYSIFDKSEVWAEGSDVLYEDAIRDRWVPATDLDWEGGLADLPEEMEKAVCQICTSYSNNGLVEQKIISRWLEEISYGYHEVKLFLATQVYDAGRKVEVLRKRALSNGGGLGQAPIGQIYRGWYGGLRFTDMLTALNVVYKSYELTMFESASEWVQTDLEGRMFELLAQDSRRHLEFGLRHTEWFGRYHPEGDRKLMTYFSRGEAALVNELRLSGADREALVVLLGGGGEAAAVGVEKLKTLRERQLSDYLDRLASVGVDRLPRVHPALAAQAEDPMSTDKVAVREMRRR